MNTNAFGIIGDSPELVNMAAFALLIEDRWKRQDIYSDAIIGSSEHISPLKYGASKEFVSNIRTLSYAADLALEYFGSKEKVISWMKAPNDMPSIFGLSPSTMIMASNGEPVIEWLERKIKLRSKT